MIQSADKPVNLIETLGNNPVHQLSHYLDTNDTTEEDSSDSLLVPAKYINACKNFRHDLVSPSDSYSSTFTKAYGSHHIIGSGSLLITQSGIHSHSIGKDDNEAVLASKPRFFSPWEVARLHGFPLANGENSSERNQSVLSFPKGITRQQQWKLLGNSLNVTVVAHLLERMFKQGTDE